MDSNQSRRLSVLDSNVWIRDLCLAVGMESDNALIMADVYIRATLRGLGHHDISMLPQRLDWIKHHGVNPQPDFRCTKAYGAVESWDGDACPGELACVHITNRAMELAAIYGIAYLSIRHSNHFLAAAPYVEMGSERGFLSMIWSNTDATMRYPQGQSAVLGNNPFGYGVPSKAEDWIYDGCMAYASLGTLRSMANAGDSVPNYWGVDASGQASSSPAAILAGGAISPMGEHKGFALALLGEVLTGLASAGTTADQVIPGGGINTHNQAIIMIDTESLAAGRRGFADNVADLENRLKCQEANFRLPGQRSAASAKSQISDGLKIHDVTFASLVDWSGRLNVAIPTNL